MTTSVIGTFDNAQARDKARSALQEAGLKVEGFDELSGAPEAIEKEITKRGFNESEARELVQAARQGKMLVAVRVADQDVDRATAFLEKLERSGGGEGREARGETERLPEVEEQLEVSKRPVEQGGVRATTRVTEKPVEQTVTLREESVDARREKADRSLSPEEAKDAFREKELELTGKAEEARVHKEARVTGEVALEKQASEHQETVKDTVRRSEVDIEKTGGKSSKR